MTPKLQSVAQGEGSIIKNKTKQKTINNSLYIYKWPEYTTNITPLLLWIETLKVSHTDIIHIDTLVESELLFFCVKKAYPVSIEDRFP